MFVMKSVLMNENEDRGDDLPGASPFVGGEGETSDNEAEDRGDVVSEGSVPDSEETPETNADGASSDSDSDGDGANDDDATVGEQDGDADASDDDGVEETPAAPMIPKKRFDAVNERMKRAEQRLEELEQQTLAAKQAPEEEFDFDSKEQEYMEAVLDGDSDKALALRKEIRAAEEAAFESKFSGVKNETIEATKLQNEFDDAVDTLETYNSILNPEAEDYDEDLVDEIVALQHGLVRNGELTPGAALLKAAGYVMGDKLALEEVKAEPEPEPEKPPKKVNVKEKIAQAQKQPANMDAGDSSSTAGEGVINVEELSEADFDALPESKKRELRGDVV